MKNTFRVSIKTHNDKSIWTYKEAHSWEEAKELHTEFVELLKLSGPTIHLPFEGITIYVNTISHMPFIRTTKIN